MGDLDKQDKRLIYLGKKLSTVKEYKKKISAEQTFGTAFVAHSAHLTTGR